MGVLDDRTPSFGPPELFSVLSQAANRCDLGIVITEWSPAAPILYVNEALASMLGRGSEELLQQDPWALLAPNEASRLRQLHLDRLSGRRVPPKVTTRVVKPTGHELPVEVSAIAVGLGGSAVTVCFVSDITDQVRAAEELRSSEARFAQLLDSAPDGVVMLRGETVIFANRVAVGMLGCEVVEDLLGKSLREFVSGDTSGVEELERASEGAETRHPLPILLSTGDGRSLEVSAVPMAYEGQRLVLAFLREVTERDAIHARLLQAERLAAIGLLASGVVHEINNPLTYVLLNLQYLHKELPKAAGDPERIKKLMHHLDEASHGASRVQNIVKDLRSFSRNEGEALVAVNLSRAMDAALAMVQPELGPSVAVRKNLARDIYVLGIAPKMEQVLLNVLTNAAHALDAQTVAPVIDIETRNVKNKVLVVISDTGPGLTDDIKEKVFDPFFTTKPRGKGTGLGLPICRSIVDSFGGRIWFSNGPRGGAQVNIELLVSAPPPDSDLAEPPQVPAATPRRAKPRILIIDDERPVVTMLARFLEPTYEVLHTTVPEDALRLLDEHRFDAILCDVMMPGMSGIDLYKAVQERSLGGERRIVFMTGGGLHPEIYEFLRHEGRPKLEKPFDMQELKRVLQMVTDSLAQEA